jgi:hypothetical protein
MVHYHCHRHGAPHHHILGAIASGTYGLQGSIELSPADSGLSLAAAPGAYIVSGGTRIAGWKP